jgi:hypothetical protein
VSDDGSGDARRDAGGDSDVMRFVAVVVRSIRIFEFGVCVFVAPPHHDNSINRLAPHVVVIVTSRLHNNNH